MIETFGRGDNFLPQGCYFRSLFSLSQKYSSSGTPVCQCWRDATYSELACWSTKNASKLNSLQRYGKPLVSTSHCLHQMFLECKNPFLYSYCSVQEPSQRSGRFHGRDSRVDSSHGLFSSHFLPRRMFPLKQSSVH